MVQNSGGISSGGEYEAADQRSRRLRAWGAILSRRGSVTLRAKPVEPTRDLVFRVANRLGANVAGRDRKREKRRELEDKSQHNR